MITFVSFLDPLLIMITFLLPKSFESLLKAEALRYGDNIDNICPEEDAESFYDENRRMSIEVRFPLATTQESKFWIKCIR